MGDCVARVDTHAVHHASITARYVAMLRTLGDRRLPERIQRHVDLLALRTRAFDEAIRLAGATQVVILGAGFDMRAHRMRELATARVFEVDRVATQALKRRRVRNLPHACRELVHIPCDLERDDLGPRLEGAGHRVDEPTMWICEGVTQYLGDLRALVATIATRSHAGSTLVVEYHEPHTRTSCYSVARRIVLALWSEPQIGLRSRHEIRQLLASAGLSIERDFAIADWQRHARIAIAAIRELRAA